MKVVIFTIFIGMGLITYAGAIPQDNRIAQHKQLVASMYRYFETLDTGSLKKKELNRFYTPNVEMIINDKLVSKGIPEFYNHFKLMLSKSHKYQFVFPKNAMISEGNRVAIKYRIRMLGKKPKTMYVIAFFTFENGKISKWNEVVAKASPASMGLTHKK